MNGDPRIASWSIDEQDEKSLNNWTIKLDLTYEKTTTSALIGSAFFIGWALTLLWLPRFGDTFGRKKMYAIAMIIDTVLFIIILTTKSLILMIITMGIFGGTTSLRVNVGYPYLMEMCPKRGQVLMGTTWNILEGLIYLIITLYFWVTVYASWIYLVLVGFVIQVWVTIAIWALPESPSWLLEKGKIKELEAAMRKIAKFNKKEIQWDPNLYMKDVEGVQHFILHVQNIPEEVSEKDFK